MITVKDYKPIFMGLIICGTAYGYEKYVVEPRVREMQEARAFNQGVQNAVNDVERAIPGTKEGASVNDNTVNMFKNLNGAVESVGKSFYGNPNSSPVTPRSSIADSDVYDRTTGTFVPRKKGVYFKSEDHYQPNGEPVSGLVSMAQRLVNEYPRPIGVSPGSGGRSSSQARSFHKGKSGRHRAVPKKHHAHNAPPTGYQTPLSTRSSQSPLDGLVNQARHMVDEYR